MPRYVAVMIDPSTRRSILLEPYSVAEGDTRAVLSRALWLRLTLNPFALQIAVVPFVELSFFVPSPEEREGGVALENSVVAYG